MNYLLFGQQKVCYEIHVKHKQNNESKHLVLISLLVPHAFLPLAQRLSRTHADSELPLSFFCCRFFCVILSSEVLLRFSLLPLSIAYRSLVSTATHTRVSGVVSGLFYYSYYHMLFLYLS